MWNVKWMKFALVLLVFYFWAWVHPLSESESMVKWTNNIRPIWIKTFVLSHQGLLGKCLNLFTPPNTHQGKENGEASFMAVLWRFSQGHTILLACLINSQALHGRAPLVHVTNECVWTWKEKLREYGSDRGDPPTTETKLTLLPTGFTLDYYYPHFMTLRKEKHTT